MTKQENELLLMMLSEMKDIKRMQEHQAEILYGHSGRFDSIDQRLERMESKLDYVYNLVLDNYGAIKEHDTRFKLLEGRMKTPRSRIVRIDKRRNKRDE